jgi:hypothetical protein
VPLGPDARGPVRLLIGLYDPVSGERLRLADGRDALPIGQVELGQR